VRASRPLAGNPLSLVPDADSLDERQMGAIDRELNQSETTRGSAKSFLTVTGDIASWLYAALAPALLAAGRR
jgi:hypothetical protein